MTTLRILARMIAQRLWWETWHLHPRRYRRYPTMPELHRRRYESIRRLAENRLRSRKVWTVEDVRFLLAIIDGRVAW